MALAANAGYSSNWTTLGSNTSNTDDIDVTQQATNVSIINGAGIDAQVRHECHVFLDYTDPIYTKPFNWDVSGDFSVMVNATNVTLAADPGNVDIDIEGSVDGVNYTKLADALTWDAHTAATRMDAFVYDYDSKGRMPYMRIAMDCGSDADNRHKPIKVVVVPH